MEMKPSNGSLMAYPVPNNSKADGVTKRERFAMAMAQGILSSGQNIPMTKLGLSDFAHESAALADALLAELEKSK